MFSIIPGTNLSSRSSSPFIVGSSSSSPFSAPQIPDFDDERSIYTSPSPVSRSLKADNVKEIYFKAYIEEKLEYHKKELEEELHRGRMRALEQALEDVKKESWMYKQIDF
uniref:BOI-related E3 ubiquitin-protein ligase 2 n=1 Tax=Angiostrongylus cantonensis TaxID=6313 RepID=A0A0K0DES0_ANGCA